MESMMSYLYRATNSCTTTTTDATAPAADLLKQEETQEDPAENGSKEKDDRFVFVLGQKHVSEASLTSAVRSLLWFTYRRDFPPIPSSEGTELTSDRGWGCMLRCGQMSLAQALLRADLGRDWRWSPGEKSDPYLDIVAKFSDGKASVFGLTQIALMGEMESKPVGTWFGPNTIAQVLKKLSSYDRSREWNIFIAMDNQVIIKDAKEASKNEDEDTWRPMLLFIPLRLGLAEINPIYYEDLKASLEIPYTVGAIGGRPNHALYFLGHRDDSSLIFLDPHTTQASVSVGRKETEEQEEADETYHTDCAGSIEISSLDPSLALCYFANSEAEFDDLCAQLRSRLIDGHAQPMFELCQERPVVPEATTTVSVKRNEDGSEGEEDEFEMI